MLWSDWCILAVQCKSFSCGNHGDEGQGLGLTNNENSFLLEPFGDAINQWQNALLRKLSHVSLSTPCLTTTLTTASQRHNSVTHTHTQRHTRKPDAERVSYWFHTMGDISRLLSRSSQHGKHCNVVLSLYSSLPFLSPHCLSLSLHVSPTV